MSDKYMILYHFLKDNTSPWLSHLMLLIKWFAFAYFENKDVKKIGSEFPSFCRSPFLYKVFTFYLYFTQNPSIISYHKRSKYPEPVSKHKCLRFFEQCVSRQNTNAEHRTKRNNKIKTKRQIKQKRKRKEATIKYRIMLQHFFRWTL